ncbi:diguanylate cyclase [Maritimibacter sp. 55A14]|uniref:ABC transporter substrate-binding protein n=1 Tax=Maritimibacter sp. 55A14 TaxID=2174844 RepID=UPI000D606693|nr:ABC transporter substrate-binding protein [Maritimibacter sp. 55A14]PWE34300.1 diguanylate cyclase [Maritimibacter sp. 55A14]
MTDPLSQARDTHPALLAEARACRDGRLGRREFLARASTLGASAALAYGLIGLSAPRAQATEPARGGTLRIQQDVRALTDPRSYDGSQMANLTRGLLEYLVEYGRDGVFHPMLLERWEVDADATLYTLHLRRGVRWNTGVAFTADDVARNIARWCDRSAPANSMAGRFASLIDPNTGLAAEGAIEIVDTHTLRLHPHTPDITLIAGMADYPAAITDASYDGGDPFAHGIGTGAYRPVALEVGRRCVLERHPEHDWWGTEVLGGPWLDRIEFIDTGTDPASALDAAAADSIDMTYETTGAFIGAFDRLGWRISETETANTITIRTNQAAEIGGRAPYADRRVRRALALAVDNAICLELGYENRGSVAANHHVSPLHPEYADIGPAPYDPAAARALMEEAEMADFAHELVSIDDDWRARTAEAATALLRDAGLTVSHVLLPRAVFWQNWTGYPFSCTDWNMRPLGVQVLALAYRSGEAWNETAFSNAEFDAVLAEALGIADPDRRRRLMARLETILREEGVIIQPYWRRLFRHTRNGLHNAGMHPAFEIHVHRIGFQA